MVFRTASQQPGSLLAPVLVQHSLTISFRLVIGVRPGSFEVDLVSCLSGLAAAVHEVIPAHDLRRQADHRVYCLAAEEQKPPVLREWKQRSAQGQKPPGQSIQTQ